MKGAPDLYLASYSAFVMTAIDAFKLAPTEDSYESIRDWIKSFPQAFQKYNGALEEKEAELLREVEKSGGNDLLQLQASFNEIKKEGILSFWRKHKL